MNKKNMLALFLCMSLAAAPAMVFAEDMAEEATEAAETSGEEAEDASAQEEAGDNQLLAPTDFTFDPNTGDYSFNAADERMGYYFIRVYRTNDEGRETGEYVASSKRIAGGKTGECSGTLDVSAMPWGSYNINLVSFAPAGTDYESPDSITLKANYGVGKKLERPEMMILASGNQAEVIVDWYSLSNYYAFEYLPMMEFSFYSDAECTEQVFSDVVDLSQLPDGDGYEYIAPAKAYVWGFSMHSGEHIYIAQTESEQGITESDFSFRNDVFTYNLDPGTYYVTCQALARDEFVLDSEPSTPIEITLTDGESTGEYTAVKTELWTDPVYGFDRMYASSGSQEDRVDFAGTQEVYGELAE